MTVRSTEMKDNEPVADLNAPKGRRKASAVVNGRDLDRLQGPFERLIGWGLLVLSFVGSVLALNGGALWPVAIEAIIGGFALQALLTVVEWIWGIRRRGLQWYNGAAILLGTGLTVYGWAAILIPSMTALWGRLPQLVAVDPQAPTVAAWVLLGALALLNEVLPEYILVD